MVASSNVGCFPWLTLSWPYKTSWTIASLRLSTESGVCNVESGDTKDKCKLMSHVKLKINKISTTVWEKALNIIYSYPLCKQMIIWKKKGFITSFYQTWENSWHLVMPPLVSPEVMSDKHLQKFHLDKVNYPDLGSASDWSCHVRNLLQPIRSTTQIWVVTRHKYGISALVSQMLFHGESSGGVMKYQLFSQVSCFPSKL